MFTSTSRLLSGVLLAGSLFVLAGCDKGNDPQDAATVTASAEDQSVAEDENAAMGDLVEAASPADITVAGSPAAEPTDLVRLAGSCFTRTFDAATRTLTLDFGPVNCVGPNGVARRGKIVAVFSGPYRQAGATTTITLVDYYRNDNHHTGTRTITNLGGGSWDLSVQGASVTTPAGTHTWTSQRKYTRTAGSATRTVLDDTYSVTGQASGTNRRGVSYTATIDQPLIKKFQLGCARTFVAGTLSITNSKEKTMLLNYDPTGTQACDNLASVTVNGKTWTIRCGR
ncbi:hypothetical protein SAMN06265337_3823 [Hymenobacter gelipurpurascens]|uniref:Lipoprotein n=1 Tax=Hymenobacter gelipurpurascens TaxID=89968 RepID=A0A212UGH2_9BACT|nr:hypothetical protein [Hymenobacter gelipurpurascens]SNC77241.1 hypothetical protein SAMN06265337_3823 [Hymenobacter gelipurpurascens]